MHIGQRRIGTGEPCYIIAELSANHNGDKNKALEIIHAAAEAGADAIKLQTYTADTMTIDHDSADFRIQGGLWDGSTLYDLYDQAHTPWGWHQELFAAAAAHGIDCFSSPFDATAVDFLETFDVPVYKLASFEINDHELIKKIAATGKPLIMSCGMSTLDEVEASLAVARAHGCHDIAVLTCVSAYPAHPADFNLQRMHTLRDQCAVIPGLSDHSLGATVAITAVALGAHIVEKHMLIKRSDGGADAAFSMEASEFAEMVVAIRAAEASIGSAQFRAVGNEKDSLCFRRSLYVTADIKAGDVFTPENIRLIRPGYGLPASAYSDVIGQRARTQLSRGSALRAQDLSDSD